MIGMRTILQVADNSGARKLSCILPRGGDVGLQAGLGDVVTAAVKEAAPDSAIRKGTVVRAVIVRMRKEQRRRDGSYIRFDENAAVLISDTGEPVGTRVVPDRIRSRSGARPRSLAPNQTLTPTPLQRLERSPKQSARPNRRDGYYASSADLNPRRVAGVFPAIRNRASS